MKKITFIVNPIAGAKDKKDIIGLIDRLLDKDKYSYDIAYTEYAGHAEALARECRSDIVAAIGGDGTLNEVARGIAGTDKVFALIPCGSGDGLALHLGISRKPADAIRTINEGRVIDMDYGTICGRPFFSICGIGLDATVSWRFARSGKRGLMTYIKEALATWKGFEPGMYRLEADGTVWEGRAAMISVGNSDQWGNMARITPLASTVDGLLDITVIKPFRTWEIPGLVLRLMTGNMHKHRKAVCLKGRNIRLTRSCSGPGHYDGDPCEMPEIIDIHVVPASLRMIVPVSYNR